MPQSGRIEALAAGVRKLARPQPSERHMWLAGLGADAKTARNGWKRARSFARKLSEPVDALFSKSGDSRLVIEGSCHAALMFGSVSPSIDASDVRALCRTMIELSAADGACGRSASHAAPTPVTADWPPWEQGYELACDLHEDLGEQFLGGDSVDIDALLRHLGVEVRELALSDSDVRGVAIAGPQHRASVAWNPRNPFNQTDAGKRFTLAHELCHILFDQEAGRRLAIASGPWAPRPIEQRANAFAAMLLMPWPLLQRCVAGMHASPATEEDIRAIAERLRTGFGATLWHLCNLDVLQEGDKERIKALRDAAQTR